jgi:hypothetical protein
MRDAPAAGTGAAFGTANLAAGRRHWFVNGDNHIRYPDLACGTTEPIATAGPTHAAHQSTAPEFGEQLLQIGQRDFLPRSNIGERNGLCVRLVPGQIGHCHNRITSFGA